MKMEKTIEISSVPLKSHLWISCFICGGFIEPSGLELAMIEHGKPVMKVCEDCKSAIAFAKQQRDKHN